jgi:Translation initiation factor IF-2, N-terminal region
MSESDLPPVTFSSPSTVREVAQALGLKGFEVIGELMKMNIFISLNEVVERRVVEKLAAKYGRKAIFSYKLPPP